jgi:hypothetical protein
MDHPIVDSLSIAVEFLPENDAQLAKVFDRELANDVLQFDFRTADLNQTDNWTPTSLRMSLASIVANIFETIQVCHCFERDNTNFLILFARKEKRRAFSDAQQHKARCEASAPNMPDQLEVHGVGSTREIPIVMFSECIYVSVSNLV